MAAQVASSRRNQAAQRQQARRRAPEPKILRIGIIHNGRIVEERLIPSGQTVTVGDSPKSTVVVGGAKLPSKRFELFAHRGSYVLNFTPDMHGKVSVDDQVVTLASLAQGGKARKKGAYAQFPLTDRNRGKVYVGDHTILFQFVTPPPQPAKKSGDFRAFRWEEVDWIFLAVLLLSALLHTAAVVYIESLPPPKQQRLEDLPSYLTVYLEPKEVEEPEPEEVEETTEAEGEETVDVPSEEEGGGAEESEPAPAPEEDPGGGGGDEEVSEEDRRAAIEEEVSEQGLVGALAILGTTGESSQAGSPVADLLSDGSGLSGDVSEALATGKVKPGRRGDATGPRRGSGGGGVAAGKGVGEGPGGGSSGTATKAAAEIKGDVKTGKAEIPAPPEDVDAVKKGMRSFNRRVKACYERELKGNPDLKGKVTVAFEISTEGAVSGVSIDENSTGNADLADCIKRELARLRFRPPPADEVTVEGYPFILTPG